MSQLRRQNELSWSAHPLAQLFRLTWPIAVSMLSYSTMTLVDTLFVGRLGPAALAGVGLGGIATWALICFSIGLLRGAKVLVSQAVGAGEHEQVGRVQGAALLWAVGLGVVTAAAGQALSPLLQGLAASSAAGAAAEGYLRLRVLAAPVTLVFCALREVRQGLGDARSPMVASLVANLANIGLDYLLIVVLHRGVEGAALASALASVIEAGVLIGLGACATLDLRRTSIRHLAALWWIGWPTGMQFVIDMGCFTLLTAMISRFSELHMAAHQIALQVIHFSFLPTLALADATSVLAGQAVGARREELVRRVARAALLAGGLYTGVCSLVFALGGRAIAGAFSGDGALVAVTARLLLVGAAFQVFDAAGTIAGGALRGTGDVRFPAVVGTVTGWALNPPAMWLLGYRLGLGAVGGWIGLCAELVIVAAVFVWRLERGGWRAAALRARALREEGLVAPAGAGEAGQLSQNR